MKIKLGFILVLSFSIASLLLSAQSREGAIPSSLTIRGKVRDAETGEMLVGVNVYLKDTQYGTATDSKGIYILSAAVGDYMLVFSYIGYQAKEIAIKLNRDMALDVSLTPLSTAIEEVQVTSQRRFFGNMDYGREIPAIDAEVIENQNINNASDILHARLSGVWATKTSGAPGDHQKIRIRGQNSFFSSAEPLYVVDGVPVPIVNLASLGIADLNIHDIENVTVLKDASSTALYGFQGGNGVVLIDTKRGGENEINFSTKFGYQWFDNFYDLMSTEDFLASLDSAYSKINSPLKYWYPAMSDTICSSDRQSDIFSPGYIQEYQLSASGTRKKLKYYLSGNYLDHDGIVPNSEYRRYTYSSRFGRVFFKSLALEINYRGSLQENKNNQDMYMGNRLLFEGITKSPCLECTPDSLFYNEMGGDFRNRIYCYYRQLNSFELPQSIIDNNNHELRISSHSISGFARLHITDHLSLNAMESLMFRHSIYNSDFWFYYYNVYGYSSSSKLILKSLEDVILFNHQYNILYSNTFGKHEMGLVLACRYYMDNLWWNVDSLEGTLSEHYYLRNSMAAYGPKGSILRSMISYIGHTSYNFRKTYFISAVANLSKVKEGLNISYYSLFPSIAISWDIAREKPLSKIKWMDNLNLYANWGHSGNYPLNGLANDLYDDVPYTFGGNTANYPSILQFANHYLKHESTAETDFGIKSSFLKKRIIINTAYYSKKINNLIIQRNIPYYYGGGKQFLNIGEISVKGIDIGVELFPLITKNFTWYIQYNFSTSEQTVTELLEGKSMSFIDYDILVPDFVIEEGEPLGNIYGYKNLGKWTLEDELAEDKHYVKKYEMKYLDADTNSRLNENDKVIIGNSIPDFTWNLFTSFKYKNFSLDLLWYAALGVDKFNSTRAATIMTGNNREINSYIADSISAMREKYLYESSVFVESADFIRLKTLSLIYEPSWKIIDKISLRFSLNFENLLTITKYKGYDPEATIFTDNNFSDNSIDRGAYPNPKAAYATVSLKF
jgi:TonB-linked SusC/RagA family outer membrane protein